MNKVVLFIVEGINDTNSFARILRKLVKSKNLKIEILFNPLDGDITTGMDIKKNLGNKINSYIKSIKINKKDLIKIVQLTDADGAYINAQSIKEHSADIEYTEDYIYTNKIEKIIERNAIKSRNLMELSRLSKSTIMGIDYQIYYFSCNLEHVLHNIQNASQEQKRKLAMQFDEKYINDLNGFVNFFNSTDLYTGGDYESTWNFIKENNHSLQRYCNFYLYLNDLMNQTE